MTVLQPFGLGLPG